MDVHEESEFGVTICKAVYVYLDLIIHMVESISKTTRQSESISTCPAPLRALAEGWQVLRV